MIDARLLSKIHSNKVIINFQLIVKFLHMYTLIRWIFRIFVRPSEYDLSVDPLTEQNYQTDIYFQPWCRLHVYLIGMVTGHTLFTTKMKIKMNKVRISSSITFECNITEANRRFGAFVHGLVVFYYNLVSERIYSKCTMR